MDPPPVSAAAVPPPSIQPNHPDSIDSSTSPSSRNAEPWNNDEPLPAVPGAKLRLMCSYGGHIMPRPHDKSLCYVGGDTRIVVVDRHSSLKDLCYRLSRTILNGRPFTLKYQLPNEDLDNLITVTTDEDLENMIEEYDRVAMKPSPSRLRVFLFFNKPESSVSMGSLLLDDAKSETWFVDALNNSGILSRVVSDSAAENCFVNLDGVHNSGSSNNLEAQGGGGTEPKTEYLTTQNENNKVKNLSEVVVNSTPGSPMLDNGSLSSSSSSPSMANLPPIRVRVDENGSRLRVGVVEEQFAQMSIGVKGDHEGFVVSSSAAVAIPAVPAVGSDNNLNRIVYDDERSDHGAPNGFKKPPLPLQLVQQPRTSGGLSLPSPDSVTSDSSIASTNSFSKAVYYQEPVQAAQPIALPNAKSEIPDQVTLPSQQMDQNQQQLQQQQQPPFVQATTHHYIHHPTPPTGPGPIPVSSYYPLYPPPPSQQPPSLHHPITQQQPYPVYVMPVGHTQPYNISLQPHKDGTPPIYPTKSVVVPSEVTQCVYKAPVPSNSNPPPALVQIPNPNQFQHQQQQQFHVGLPQLIHHPPPQSIAIAAATTTGGGAVNNYGYDQAYYTQQQQTTAPILPPQYQSMTPAAAAQALSDASKQFPSDNVQQPNRTSQPV